MASYTTGKELYEKMLALQEKTSANITDAKQVLEPKLNAQGLTLTEGNTYSSIINDMKKMVTVERNIENGNLDDMTFVDNGLFASSILPSNAVMINMNRIVFIEEGLLYIMEIDTTTMLTTYKKIYKIDVIWDICNGTTVNLLYDDYNHNVFIYPTYGNKIVSIHGDGLYTTGKIEYNTIDLVENTNILGLGYIYMEVAFITGDRRYHRIYDYDNTVDYIITDSDIDDVPIHFTPTVMCDGNFNYVATDEGSVYRYSSVSKVFTYYTDIYNEKDEAIHIVNRDTNPDNYPPILAFAKNHKRVNLVTEGQVFTTYSDNILDFENPFSTFGIPYRMLSAKMTVNRIDPNSKTMVYGFNENLEMVAFYFTNESEPVEEVELGNAEAKPQYILFNCCDLAGVMIQVYETTLKASDYYTADDIQTNGYKDYTYTSITMKIGLYEGNTYQFTQEFVPLFIPDKIVTEKDTTIVTAVSPSSPLFNIAITNDHLHWSILNIPDDIAINVQDIASGDNTFVMVGLFAEHILVSNYGYEWRAVALPHEMSLMSITYNSYYNKFYAMTNEGTEYIEYDHNTDTLNYYTLGVSDMSFGRIPTKIASCHHKLFLVYKSGQYDQAIFETKNTPFDDSPLFHQFQNKVFNITNEYDKYYGNNFILRDIKEIGDDMFAIFEIDAKWNPTSEIEYEQKLITGMVIHVANYDIELNDLSNSISRATDRVVFPLDPDESIDLTVYLNHVIINHPSNKGYISANNQLPIIYGEINTGKYYTILANAKGSVSSEGYLHLIQNLVNSFTRYSYIVTTDSWYDPTVTAADLDYGKKSFRIKEYGLEYTSSEVDKNGNIDTYPILLSNIKNTTGGSIIYTDRFYMVTKGKYLYMSDDGMNWSFRQLPKDGDWRDICYNGTIYVIVNYIDMNNSEIYYSNNLYDWTIATLPLMLGWSEITFDGTYFIVAAGYLTTNKNVIRSTDGINWSSVECITAINTNRILLNGITGGQNRINSFNNLAPTKSYSIDYVTEWFNDGDGFEEFKDKPIMCIEGFMEYPRSSSISIIYLFSDGTIGMKNMDDGNIYREIVAYLDNKPKYMRMIVDTYGRLFFFFYNTGETFIYMGIINDENDASFNLTRINLPIAIDRDNAHLFCYHDGKVMIGTSQPIIIDLADTYPDIIEGSFNVMSGETHNESLPFTPDHVFLFGAKSYNTDNRFFIGEIHRNSEFSIDGSNHTAMKFFNNTLETIGHRSDVTDKIMESSFIFTNNTLNDRHINYIAIKEDHYN